MEKLVWRLNRIMSEINGYNLEFQTLENLNRTTWKEDELRSLENSESSTDLSYLQNQVPGRIGFPVKQSGKTIGLAVVDGISTDNLAEVVDLAQLLALVLESALQTKEELEKTTALERQVDEKKVKSNVIPLRRVSDTATKSFDIDDLPEEPTRVILRPILIQVKPGFPAQHLVVEIHELAQRWALVPIEDLPKDVLASKEGLKALGGMTVYIKDLTKLTAAEQTGLADFLQSNSDVDAPLIIATTSATTEVLEQSVSKELLKCFFNASLACPDQQDSSERFAIINEFALDIFEQARPKTLKADRFIPFHARLLDPNLQGTH